jgi:class 3 adenylate cyclase/CHASE2 domain-containing sensor protein
MIKQRILIGFAAVLLAALALMHWHAFDWAERALLDAEFRYLRAHYAQAVEKDVVLIGIDEAALAAQREPFALWHPYLGRLLKGLALAKPAVAGLDVVLPSRSFDFLIPQYDRPLLEGITALGKVAPVVLAQSLDDRGNQRTIFPAYLAIAGLDGAGPVIVCRDSDRIVRRYDERECGFGESSSSFAGRMAQHLGVQKKSWQGFINYSIGDAITYIPVQKVLEWIEHNNEASLNEAFRGKPVMLGMIQPFIDRYPLPVALAAFEPDTRLLPGVLIQVQALRSMLGPGLIAPLSAEFALALAAVAALFWFGAGGWRKTLVFALATAALLALATALLLWKNVQFPAASLVGVSLLALASRFAYDTLLKSHERRLLREAFAGYVNPQILKKILRGRIRPGLSGTRHRVCVMFCNIRGFTSRAERMSPEAVIKLLNDYFSAAVSAVLKHEGTTNKVSGDGMLAFFGAPQQLANPEKNALEASQDVLENLVRLNEQLAARGQEPLTVGIGLHSGEVVLGQVGAVSHREYTVIGDVVNVASRLELATTELGYPVVCSAGVADAVGRAGGLEDLGERTLRGHPVLHVFGWRPRLLSSRAP